MVCLPVNWARIYFWTLENGILVDGNLNMGSLRPNVPKWVRGESNGFLHALEEWLIILELT